MKRALWALHQGLAHCFSLLLMLIAPFPILLETGAFNALEQWNDGALRPFILAMGFSIPVICAAVVLQLAAFPFVVRRIRTDLAARPWSDMIGAAILHAGAGVPLLVLWCLPSVSMGFEYFAAMFAAGIVLIALSAIAMSLAALLRWLLVGCPRPPYAG